MLCLIKLQKHLKAIKLGDTEVPFAGWYSNGINPGCRGLGDPGE